MIETADLFSRIEMANVSRCAEERFLDEKSTCIAVVRSCGSRVVSNKIDNSKIDIGSSKTTLVQTG